MACGRLHIGRRAVFVLLAGAACNEAAVELPVEPVNRPPTTVGAIPDRSLSVGRTDTVDISGYFRDPDGDSLSYTAKTSDTSVATAAVSASSVMVSGVAEGTATVTVTARDPGGASAQQGFGASVLPFAVSIAVSPPTDTIAPSAVAWLVATATDSNGDAVDGFDFRWSSSNPTVARVLAPAVFLGGSSDSARVHGELEGTATISASAAGASGAASIAVVNPDPAALMALYEATNGAHWLRNGNWLTEASMGLWDGVDINIYHRVIGLYLQGNRLDGRIPPELGQLTLLRELALSDNPGLSGPIPESFAALDALSVFVTSGTDLCAPANPGLLAWLEGLEKAWIARCGAEATLAYLTQAVQSRQFPVPLVAGKPALLRVFPVAQRTTSAGIPPVRATFHLPKHGAYVVDIPGSDTPIPTSVSEGSLRASANAEIADSLVQPGLEMVVEIDPDGTLDPALEVPRRIPDSGRIAVDVRRMPMFRLTVIPFVSESAPDTSVLGIARAMSEDPHNHALLGQTRMLLPLGELEVAVHEPVTTSANTALGLLAETEMIRVVEAGEGHYLGTMTGQLAGIDGRAYQNGRSTFSMVDRGARSRFVIAHELGHNMGLRHPPGCGAGQPDNAFPHSGGTTGAWGYDFRGGVLLPPTRGDLMSYCSYDWISDYHFANALRYRLADEGEGATAFGAPRTTRRPQRVRSEASESLLLWGGVARGEPYLEPAVVVDAWPALPESGGHWQVTGRTETDEELFSLRFDMPEVADDEGVSGFAFVLPVQTGWVGNVATIALSGPGGNAVLTADTGRPVRILRNPRTGRIRGILRGAGAAFPPSTPLEVLDSQGIPAPLVHRR